MKRLIASFILFFVLSSGSVLHAQYDSTAFYGRTYSPSDGLPDSYILNIYQDEKQYLWIGTFSGLSRFDGTSFTNYGIHNGLPDLYVNQFIEFGDRLWVATRTSIGYLEKDHFVRTEFNDGMKIDFVFGFSEVIPGKLWAFTSHGLYEWANDKWIKKVFLPGLENTGYRQVLKIKDKLYFCFHDRIVIRENNGDTTMITTNSKKYPYFLSISEFKDRVLFHTPDGLFEYKNQKCYPLFEGQLKGKRTYYYWLDSKNRYWIATREEGILVSKPNDDKNLTYKVPLNFTLVSKIFEDRSHNIWIANFQGLVKIKNSFFDIPSLPGRPAANHRFIPAIDTKGNFFVYDDKNGLSGYDSKKLLLKKFAHSNNYLQNDLNTSLIDGMCIDDKQNFWIVGRTGEIVKVNPLGKQLQIFPGQAGNPSMDFAAVCWDNIKKKIYCGGTKLFVGQNDHFEEFRSTRTGQPIKDITRLLALTNGDILVNSGSSGVWLIKPDGNAYNQSAGMIIPVDSRLFFAEDMNGKIWVSITGNGLKRLSYSNDSSLVAEIDITTMSGLPNDVVETIAVDSKNRLWAATLSGLIVMDTLNGSSGKKFVMYNIGRDHGLDLSIHTGLTKMIADKDRNIWFCSTEKIVLFRSNDFKVLSNPPVTHIENVKLNMKETDWHLWSNSLDGYYMLPQDLVLPHNQNTLTFSFKGINYNSDEKVWYSYKLIGVDTAWGPATEDNVISFIKLTPGTFTFMVRTRNNNSPWGDPSNFTFTIKQPFWSTWWFRGIGILITSIILALIFRVQLLRVRKRAALETQLRNLEMKALKAQMNPHFIYNALNSIQSLVIDDKKTDALDYMVKFSRLLRQVLNHSELNIVNLAKELEGLKLYIQLESLRLNYSLNYSIKLDDNIIPEKEMIPPMILQPFVENALWHGLSKKEGNKVLYIYVRGEENCLRFDISDNGIGRASAAEMKKPDTYYEGPRGIDITKTRLSLYNLNTAFEPLEVHDIINQDNSSGGTIVTVRIKRQ